MSHETEDYRQALRDSIYEELDELRGEASGFEIYQARNVLADLRKIRENGGRVRSTRS
jgi:hypothetical protein